ncbi:MAG: hypothetical protein Q9168_004656 [Polycauliona sp. 1 TL-2023]
MANQILQNTSPHLLSETLQASGLELSHANLVRWKHGCVQHPRNWPTWKKVYNAAVAIFLDYFIRATYLLKQKVEEISKKNGQTSLRIENPDHVPDFPDFVRLIFRPLRLLFTEPIVAMVSIISGTAFALVYLFIEVLPIVYGDKGFTKQQSSLVLVAVALGFCFTPLTRIYDHRCFKKAKQRGRSLAPEDKLMGFVIAAPAFAIGLWCFAWTIPPEVAGLPWIVSALALVPIGFAINEFDCVLVGYLTESYATFSSSAFASFSMVRSGLSATFPLFAHGMYEGLGANYATTVLAAAATIACICPFVLVRYGKRIRQASIFAQYSLTVERLETDALETEENTVGTTLSTGMKAMILKEDVKVPSVAAA